MLGGCSQKKENSVLTTTISNIKIKANGHKEQLSAYDSPYTICYRNENDTYSMYIFSSPIQYKTDSGEYKIIDNAVVEANEERFAFENKANDVKTYFPKTISEMFRVEKGEDFFEFRTNWDVSGFEEAKKIIFTNMYGDKVNAVIYERSDMSLIFYPTKSGIKLEIMLNEQLKSRNFSFTVNSSASDYENQQNGYILFKSGNENRLVIYQPLVQYTVAKKQHLDVMTKMSVKRVGGEYHIINNFDETILNNDTIVCPIKIDLSFEMYLNKMPDSTVYSKRTVNNYLSNYAVVGEHPLLGEGWHYIRYRLNFFFHANSENIKQASYFIKNLYASTNESTSLYKVNSQWSSTGILWSSRIEGDEHVSNVFSVKRGYEEYPITAYVQDCVGAYSWESESIGVLMKTEQNSGFYKIFATSDNSLYSPYILINLDAPPVSFEIKNNINENMN